MTQEIFECCVFVVTKLMSVLVAQTLYVLYNTTRKYDTQYLKISIKAYKKNL